MKFQLGLSERPYVDEQHEANALLTVKNRAAARALAQKSIVLLRNEGNVLPLPKSVGTIAVIGPLADSKADMLGSWFGKGTAAEAVSVLGGLRAKVSAATLYSKGVDVAATRLTVSRKRSRSRGGRTSSCWCSARVAT